MSAVKIKTKVMKEAIAGQGRLYRRRGGIEFRIVKLDVEYGNVRSKCMDSRLETQD